MNRFLSAILIFILLFCISCDSGLSRADDPAAVENPSTALPPQGTTGSIPQITFEQSADNPYKSMTETREFWWFYIHEFFHDAEEITVEYNAYSNQYVSEDTLDRFTLRFSLPSMVDDNAFSKSFNAFYADKAEKILSIENSFQQDYASHGLGYPFSYDMAVFKVYRWQNFCVVISTETTMFGREFANPIGETFDMTTGRRINLSDLFYVEEDEYEPILREVLRNPVFPPYTAQMLSPDADKLPIPLPDNENFSVSPGSFALSPVGIVFMYQTTEISATAGGPVFLIVPYAEIADILNPTLFGQIAGNKN